MHDKDASNLAFLSDVVRVICFGCLFAATSLAADFSSEPVPDPELRARIYEDVVQTIAKLEQAPDRLMWYLTFARLFRSDDARAMLIEHARHCFGQVPRDSIALYAHGKLPELFPNIIARCPDERCRDLARVRFISTSEDPWSVECQSLYHLMASPQSKHQAMKHIASDRGSSASFDICSRFWFAELENQPDDAGDSFEWFALQAFLTRFSRSETKRVCDFIDQAMGPKLALKSLEQLLRRANPETVDREILVTSAVSSVPRIFEAYAQEKQGFVLPTHVRMRLEFLIKKIAIDRPEVGLEIIDRHVIPAVQRGHLLATAVTPSILSGIDAFNARIDKVKHIETRFASDAEYGHKASDQKIIDAAAAIAVDPILEWLETTQETQLRDRCITSGFWTSHRDAETIQRWTDLITLITDSQQRRTAKFSLRSFLRHKNGRRVEESRLNFAPTIQAEPFQSAEEFVEFESTEFRRPWKYAHEYILKDRFVASPTALQAQVLKLQLQRARRGQQNRFLELVGDSTVDWPEKLKLLESASSVMPDRTVAIVSVARHGDLSWAMKTLWPTLPPNRGPGTPRMRCEELTRAADGLQACEVLGLEYGAVRAFRETPNVAELVSDFITEVPKVDGASLRRGLFELLLDQYRFSEAYHQSRMFESLETRLQLYVRILSFSRSAYE